MHLLFEQTASVRILSGNGVLVAFHLAANGVIALHFRVKVFAFFACDAGLFFKCRAAFRIKLIISHAIQRRTGNLSAAQALEQKDARRGAGEQRFVMRNKEYGQLAGEQKVFQPQDGIAVEVVGRLIEQQRCRAAHQQAGELQFDPFAAGKGLHELVAVKDIGGQAQTGGKLTQFARRLIEKDGRHAEKIVGTERPLGFGKLLRQIRRAVPTGE